MPIERPSTTQTRQEVQRSVSLSLSRIAPEEACRPSSRRFLASGSVAVVALLTGSVLIVHAALTLNSTGVAGNGEVNLTGVGTSTIDVGSGTLRLQTTSNGPLTLGNGVTTIPNASGTNETLSGYLTVAGSSTFTGLASFKSTGNNVQYADQFPGADSAAKVNAAIAALPASGGTVDARGLTGAQAMGSNISLGSDTKPVTLLLGNATITRGVGAQFLYFNQSHVIGVGGFVASGAAATSIVGKSGDTAAAFVYGGTGQPAGLLFQDFQVLNNTGAGSIGIDWTRPLASIMRNVEVSGDTALQVGGSGWCACYNSFYNVFARGSAYGVHWKSVANQNQWFGGQSWTSSAGVGMFFDGASTNQIYSDDVEGSSAHAFEISGQTNAIFNPYLESTGPILLDSGANGNFIIGGSGSGIGFVDNSGNTSNYIKMTGASGDTGGWGSADAVSQTLYWGDSIGGDYNDKLGFHMTPNSGGFPFDLNWYGQALTVYGHYGHAHINVGHLGATGGASIEGKITEGQIGDPSAPTVSVVGTSGSTSYSYYVVAHDETGGITKVSSAGSTSIGNAILSSANYNQICWPAEDGVWGWDVLKNNTSTALATNLGYGMSYDSTNKQFCYKDTGQATSAYTPPTRNSTGDVTVAGSLSEGCAGTAALSGGSASITNSCITGSRPVICTDNTATSSAACTAVRSSGSVTLYGSGSDTISWAQL